MKLLPIIAILATTLPAHAASNEVETWHGNILFHKQAFDGSSGAAKRIAAQALKTHPSMMHPIYLEGYITEIKSQRRSILEVETVGSVLDVTFSKWGDTFEINKGSRWKFLVDCKRRSYNYADAPLPAYERAKGPTDIGYDLVTTACGIIKEGNEEI